MMESDPTALSDMHSHLVPGVDDGARTVEDALDAVERMTQLGIRRIITTPHLDGSLTVDPEALEERLSEVDAAFAEAAARVREAFPEVVFARGHEVMLDIPDVRLDDPRLHLAESSFVLVEWPRLHVPPGTGQVVERIRAAGIRPIIAHPERYIGVDRELEVVRLWREKGAFLQVNYGSLLGRYGSAARTVALRLVRRGWADYLASDFHAGPDRGIYKEEAWDRISELGGHEALVHMCLTNPGRIFRDLDPLPVPPLPPDHGFWARVRGILRPESA